VAQQAPASPERICDQVARQASSESGVPLSVLQAITRVETGRAKTKGTQPWPWTVNMEGKGVWFDTEDEARAYVFQHYKRGARSFDIGCFQINFKWHGQAFNSIEEMFDPITNARYAAKFLTQLYNETGDWSAAAGAFHSRTPKYADKYKVRFDRFRSALMNDPPAQADESVDLVSIARNQAQTTVPRENRFPLLLAGAQPGSLGSLVPLTSQTNRSQFIALTSPEGS
jgi:hypothetical protein